MEMFKFDESFIAGVEIDNRKGRPAPSGPVQPENAVEAEALREKHYITKQEMDHFRRLVGQ